MVTVGGCWEPFLGRRIGKGRCRLPPWGGRRAGARGFVSGAGRGDAGTVAGKRSDDSACCGELPSAGFGVWIFAIPSAGEPLWLVRLPDSWERNVFRGVTPRLNRVDYVPDLSNPLWEFLQLLSNRRFCRPCGLGTRLWVRISPDGDPKSIGTFIWTVCRDGEVDKGLMPIRCFLLGRDGGKGVVPILPEFLQPSDFECMAKQIQAGLKPERKPVLGGTDFPPCLEEAFESPNHLYFIVGQPAHGFPCCRPPRLAGLLPGPVTTRHPRCRGSVGPGWG